MDRGLFAFAAGLFLVALFVIRLFAQHLVAHAGIGAGLILIIATLALSAILSPYLD